METLVNSRKRSSNTQMRKPMQHNQDIQSTVNEIVTSAPKASATILNSLSSSKAGMLLASSLSHWRERNAEHCVLDKDGSRTGHGHPQHNLAVLQRSAPISCAK